ncbi:MAG: hypothetical protein ACLSB9_20670 [Hydrogeniiclostridium mannosilyticum]
MSRVSIAGPSPRAELLLMDEPYCHDIELRFKLEDELVKFGR